VYQCSRNRIGQHADSATDWANRQILPGVDGASGLSLRRHRDAETPAPKRSKMGILPLCFTLVCGPATRSDVYLLIWADMCRSLRTARTEIRISKSDSMSPDTCHNSCVTALSPCIPHRTRVALVQACLVNISHALPAVRTKWRGL